jgi:hypothetical protein
MGRSRRRRRRRWELGVLASGRIAVILVAAAGLAAVPDVTDGFSALPTPPQVALLSLFATVTAVVAVLLGGQESSKKTLAICYIVEY